MKFILPSLLMLCSLQPAIAQRKYNHSGNAPLQFYTVKVAGGSFDLGSDEGAADRKPHHTVTLDDFSMTAYEITQEQWKLVMGSNPSNYKCEECPVTNVSYKDIQLFIDKLHSMTGKTYRLPTEAEWEYAARGGNKETLVKTDENGRRGISEVLNGEGSKRVPDKMVEGKKYSGKRLPQEVAWFSRNSRDHIHPIGRKDANELGLFDMSGNVEEWCADFYAKGYGSKQAKTNPKGPDGGNAHVVRGGSWNSSADEITVTRRAAYVPDTRTNALGFRLVADK